jgi:hypothetical protein
LQFAQAAGQRLRLGAGGQYGVVELRALRAQLVADRLAVAERLGQRQAGAEREAAGERSHHHAAERQQRAATQADAASASRAGPVNVQADHGLGPIIRAAARRRPVGHFGAWCRGRARDALDDIE